MLSETKQAGSDDLSIELTDIRVVIEELIAMHGINTNNMFKVEAESLC